MNRTNLGNWPSVNFFGTGAFVTGSFTPPANALLVVAVAVMGNGTTGDLGTPTISGGGLDYSMLGSARSDASWSRRVTVFTAIVGANPASMVITIDDDTNQNIFTYGVAAIAYSDYDTGTPVVGYVSSGSSDIGDGAHTLSLGVAPALGDESVMVCSVDAVSTPNNPTMASGWTKIYDVLVPDGGASLVMGVRGSSSNAAVDITDVYTAGGTFYNGSMIAFVVKAAEAGVVVTPAAAVARYVVVNPIVVLGGIVIAPTSAAVKISAVNPTVILGVIIITPAAAVVRGVSNGPVVLGGGGVINPLGEGDTPGLLVFMVATSIYRNLNAEGLITGIDEPNSNNAGDWENYLFS